MLRSEEQHESTQEFTSETRVFHHEGISYDSEKFKISFSLEAIETLQQLVNNIQKGFLTEEEFIKKSEETHETKKVTLETASSVADAMFVAGKSDTMIEKFLKRVGILLGKKKKGNDLKEVEKKVSKKFEKYGHTQFVHIIVQYTVGSEIKAITTPIIVRSGENLEKMIESLQARIGFAHIR